MVTDRVPNLAGQRAVVVGLGHSGTAAAELLVSRGAHVIATDARRLDQLGARARGLEAQLIVGGHGSVPWTEVDLVVVSPGVPDLPGLGQALAAGVEVIGETELASRFVRAPICAVGGTNGKSTVTVLLGELLKAASKKVFVGGNLGQPACEAPAQAADVVVLEVSSFQMERLREFRPRVAVLLNVSEDHLDRYASFSQYVSAKGNCFENQGPGDTAVYPVGSPLCLEQAQRGSARLVSFGETGDFFVADRSVVDRSSGYRYELAEVDLHGRHNHENAAAAIAMARALGLPEPAIEAGLRNFRALPHRMALSGRIAGVNFYNDSKATNVGSAVTALRGLTEDKGVLIAGGRDKLGSFDELVRALSEKGRAVVLIGEAADRMQRAIASTLPVHRADSLESAVQLAAKIAQSGDAVLLSPACSSFDMFKNYSDRGERFTEAVRALSSGPQENPR